MERLELVLGGVVPEQAALAADPQAPALVLEQRQHAATILKCGGQRVVAEALSFHPLQPTIGAYPQAAGVVEQERRDLLARQAVRIMRVVLIMDELVAAGFEP